MIKKTLKKLGLSDYEVLVYEALAQHSPAGASLLARKTNLSRSTVYTVLSALTAKGLVGTTYKNEVKQFVTEGFSSLKQLVDRERQEIKEKARLLPTLKEQLQLLSGDELHIPEVVFFEGQEGLKKIYLSMLREARKDSVMYIVRDEWVWKPDWKFIFEPEWHKRVRRWKQELNIATKLLVNPSNTEKRKKSFYASRKNLKIRFLPPKHKVVGFAMYIINDFVSILSMEKNHLVGIRITNRHLSDNFENLFKVLWQKGD